MTEPTVRVRYPEIEPFEHGMLAVGDDNHLYWETCGNPDGMPALVLHGGPGSGRSTSMRRYFDPVAYRIVLFDQRNCGRSTPHASDPAVSLAANTTSNLLADIELLREHLGISRWLVFGWSWGSALALAYAERHSNRVSAAVLTGVGSGRRAEVELFTRGLGGRRARRLAGWQPARRLQPAAQSARPGGAREGRARLVRLGGGDATDLRP
jgi:proline iminopeptidase